jgi:hypothetical protein
MPSTLQRAGRARLLAWVAAPLAVAALTALATIRVHVGSLRRKLEPDPAEPRYIGTEPWVGYRFLAEPEEADGAS